ncbi:MAG: methylenetetrahydrofolate reductase, partial [Candidatus Binataceae bacterium]
MIAQGDNRDRPLVSELAHRLAQGRFVVTAELNPPVATDLTDFLKHAVALRGLATAVNVTDGAGARVSLSSIVAARFLLDNGIEPIVQMACRDRNRIALQGDILGAVALGIHNVLMLTGDDPKAGDQPETKAVFDLKSQDLLAIANRMRLEQKLPSGAEIKGDVGLLLGAADSPIDPPPDWNPKSLREKVAAGVDFIQTQFCMDLEIVRRYTSRLLEMGIAQHVGILIGICPIPSARSAHWMLDNLPGTIIPPAIIERLEQASDSRREGRIICVELLQRLREIPGVAGAHIMAPLSHSAIPEVI